MPPKPKHKCNVCGNEFHSSGKLLEHRSFHVDTAQRCMFCQHAPTYIREVDLHEHFEKHMCQDDIFTAVKALLCANKGVPTASVKPLIVQQEYQKSMEQKKYQCNICGHKMKRENTMKVHNRRKHSGNGIEDSGDVADPRRPPGERVVEHEGLIMPDLVLEAATEIGVRTRQRTISVQIENDPMADSVIENTSRRMRYMKQQRSTGNTRDVPESKGKRKTMRSSDADNQPGPSDNNKAKKKKKIVVKTFDNGLVCCDLPLHFPYNISNKVCDGPDLVLLDHNGVDTNDKEQCRIPPNAPYMSRKVGDDHDDYCMDCFELVTNDRATFTEQVNENPAFEDILECMKCEEKRHRCCTTFIAKETQGYFCEKCSTVPSAYMTLSNDSSKKTELSMKIEDRLNFLLKDTEHPTSVRTLLTAYREVPTSELAPELYLEEFETTHGKKIAFRVRAIYVFQRQEGIDLLFFVIYAVEYKNPEWRVEPQFVVDYLDSVELMTPLPIKGMIYRETMLTYFEFLGCIGYMKGFLWSNPPSKGDDYIFNIHPPGQGYLPKKVLEKWYTGIFESGMKDSDIEGYDRKKVIKHFWNLHQMQSRKREMLEAKTLPLFLNDSLWTKVMKKCEKDLENEKEKMSKTQYKLEFDELMKGHFKEHKTDNFTIQLEKPSVDLRDLKEKIHEDDVLFDRQAFLSMCVENNLEWVNQRRALHASMFVIQRLETVLESGKISEEQI